MKKKLSTEQKKQKAEYAKEWRIKNPDKTREHSKRTRIKNKDKIAKRQRDWTEKNKEKKCQKSKEWYSNNKDRVRDKQLQNAFGITLEEYNKMLSDQKEVCFICGGGPDAKSKRLAVDHDHNTGKVRSLLCRGCNVGIGNLKDSPELLEIAAIYIRKHRE